jgi:hypothetical protein
MTDKQDEYKDLKPEERIGSVLRNIERLKPKERNVRWYFVSLLFGYGSGYSYELCLRYGLDPDEEIGASHD